MSSPEDELNEWETDAKTKNWQYFKPNESINNVSLMYWNDLTLAFILNTHQTNLHVEAIFNNFLKNKISSFKKTEKFRIFEISTF